ncbi:MAG: NfeD family protein [Solirubrobacterales bacterium]
MRSGPEHLIGTMAEVRESLSPVGQVFVDGGLWKARLEGEEVRAGVGEEVEIVAIDGLTLLVRNNEGDVTEGIERSATSGLAGESEGVES